MTADPLTQLDIQDEITVIMAKLGYGVSPVPATPTDDTSPDPAQTAPEIPRIVTDYLAGQFVKQKTDEFIATLEQLEPYVTTFITMPQVCDGANSWWEKTGKQLAA
ncbi:ddrA (plasmid) [Xenorhabdus stockiae]|uniref:ddrA n=1 Tax=Xenorhabdus stockiae TaxID=351614 RepID=UPI003CE84AA4